MYTPTNKELEEIGFYVRVNEKTHIYDVTSFVRISFDFENIEFRLCDVSGDRDTILWEEIYPESIEDLKTLIRILTPQ